MTKATLALVALAALAACSSHHDIDIEFGSEQTFALEELSAPAQQTIRDNLADGTIEEIERSDDFADLVYEVEISHPGGRETELLVANDGRLLDIEHDDDDEQDDDD